jgi:cytidine deaminase
MSETTATYKLSDTDAQRLLEAARDVRLRAHAPYSHYQVGAAVLGDDGHIYGGCNIENCSYGLCMCAERVAIAAAISAGCRKPVALAVVTKDGAKPCGACRQVMVEFNPDMIVLTAGFNTDPGQSTTSASLIPDYFKL